MSAPTGTEPDFTPLSQPLTSDGTPAWLVVTKREVVVKMTDRNFLISTALTLLIVIASLGFNGFMAGRPSTTTVAVTSADAAQVIASAGAAWHTADDRQTLTSTTVADDSAARSAVDGGDADAYLRHDGDTWSLVYQGPLNTTLLTYVGDVVRTQALTRNAAAAGTTLEALAKGSLVVPQVLVKPGEEQKDETAAVVKLIAGFVFAMLYYLASLLFGLAIAQSVVEEKQSRVVEILATAIPIRQLLIGKIVGNTLLALGQMLLFVGVGLIGVTFTSYSQYLSSLTGPATWYLVFFLAGFVALACIWAVDGSLASRSEDLQSTTMPLTMVLVVALFIGISASGVWQVVASYVPVISTITMPMRLLDGTAAWWEAAISLLLTLAFAAVTVLLGEKLYRRSVLQTGGRVSLKQAMSAEID